FIATDGSTEPPTNTVVDAVPVGSRVTSPERRSEVPSNSGTIRPATVVVAGWDAAVDCVMWFALVDLSFQQPTEDVAAAPVQVDPAYRVELSAPSSHRARFAGLITVEG